MAVLTMLAILPQTGLHMVQAPQLQEKPQLFMIQAPAPGQIPQIHQIEVLPTIWQLPRKLAPNIW